MMMMHAASSQRSAKGESMARTLLKGDIPAKRVMRIRNGEVTLRGYTLKPDKESDAIQYDEITLEYPGGENTPDWIVERAAKSDWITIQAWLRKQNAEAQIRFEGRIVDCSDLDKALGKERVKGASLKARLDALTAGKLTNEEFLASLTKSEGEQIKALVQLARTNIEL